MKKIFIHLFIYIFCFLALLLYLDIHNIPSKFGISISFWQDFLINFLVIGFTIYGTLTIVKLQIKTEKINSEKKETLYKLLDGTLFSSLYMGVGMEGNAVNITEIGNDLTLISYGINRIELNKEQLLFKMFYERYKKLIPKKLKNELDLFFKDYTTYYKFIKLPLIDVRDKYKIINITDFGSKNYIILSEKYCWINPTIVDQKMNWLDFNIEKIRISKDINVGKFLRIYDEYNRNETQVDITICDFTDKGDFDEDAVSSIVFDRRIKKICQDIVYFLSKD